MIANARTAAWNNQTDTDIQRSSAITTAQTPAHLRLGNLACYRSVLRRKDEAKKLLAEAFTLDASLRLIASDDPDLAGLW